jgi:hypothetical protein
MQAVDLAVYADVLAGRSAALAARLEQTRGRIRQAAIERAARRELDAGTRTRLEELGALGTLDAGPLRREADELEQDLRALDRLQAWVEARLFEAREERSAA